MKKRKFVSLTRLEKRITPPQTIVFSFMLLILSGAMLLNLPVASKAGESIGFLNALFTATSAVCVTGLVVVNTLASWSVFGKVIIIALIQLGGLGLMTVLTLAMVVMRRNISLKDRLVIQASFNQSDVGGMVRLVKRVVVYTVVLEAAGAGILALGFYFIG